jgi:hypothetical protein
MDPVESVPPTTLNARAQRTRNRHEARLCRRCRAPMAGQTDHCWKCGTAWEPGPPDADSRRSLDESVAQVQEVRALRRDDAERRNRPPAPRAQAAGKP